ncbi:F-box protein At5g07610 [Manihot esculenta]|uniref:Uncharacterized protein n=1 Tax=Manihot esculenta TaxID=3983 RepID=A0ACB7H3J3_MANES|nr:F-box protein At5g07610 [Manihot esculenta]KAG8647269.1 hypothetical protein MANES_09G072126v8 [Manihot esculenta]
MASSSDVLMPIIHQEHKSTSFLCGLEELPDDLLVNILCQLSDRLLVRCRCVCRTWNNLISNVCIPKAFAASPLCGLLYRGYKYGLSKNAFAGYIPYGQPLDLVPNNSQAFVNSYTALLPFENSPGDFCDCCSGLLLFVNLPILQFYVCNPVTKQCAAIPTSSAYAKPIHASLAFNPSESPHYKVFCIDRMCSHILNLHIFSSDVGKWVTHLFTHNLRIYGTPKIMRAIYLNGSIFVCATMLHMLIFSLSKEKSLSIELPEYKKHEYVAFFGVSKGCLYYSNHDNSILFLWRLEVNRWILMHNICFNDLAKDPFGSVLCQSHDFMIMPCALHPTSNIIFLWCPRMIISYHLDNHTIELICEMDKVSDILMGQYTVRVYTHWIGNLKDFN